ncbi:MFS transporter [Rhodococcoides fascians]|uniref:MFS transporter n=1 Tax=Rhodococcoides fascians TaxID=1828 RepID=UPI000A60CE1C|nr:MFS transporter [Rhodococcus fascians]
MSRDFSTPRAKNLALALLALTQFLIVIDASIVNVALPSIGESLGIGQDGLSWVINAYILAFGGFLLLGGRLADLLGRRKMFGTGLLIFTVASLMGGLAQNDAWLNIARAVQGLGAAIVSPAALSILTTTFKEGSERNRALAVWGAMSGAGGAAGVLLGGVLTEYLGWEWVLFVNVPVGLFMVWQAFRLFPASSRVDGARSFDLPGSISVTAGLALLVFTLVDAEKAGWTSTTTLLRAAAAVALLVVFVVIERRSAAPLVTLSIFRLRTLRGANVVVLLVGASLISGFFLITLYLQQVLGFTPLQAGLAYLPLALSIHLRRLRSVRSDRPRTGWILGGRDRSRPHRNDGRTGRPRFRSRQRRQPNRWGSGAGGHLGGGNSDDCTRDVRRCRSNRGVDRRLPRRVSRRGGCRGGRHGFRGVVDLLSGRS